MSITGVESQQTYSIEEYLNTFGSTSATQESGEFTDDMAEQLMSEFDSDGDGVLSESEMAALTEKVEGMRDMMAALAQAMQSQSDSGSGESAETEEEDVDVVAAFMESAFGSSESTDAADANGDGVVTQEELADYLGAQYEATQEASSGETETASLKDQLMSYALSAYGQNADSSMSDAAMELIGSSDSTGVDAIA